MSAERKCTVEDCERVHYAKGYCNMHWARWRKYGTPELPRKRTLICSKCLWQPARANGLCQKCYMKEWHRVNRPAPTRKAKYTLEDYTLEPGPLATPCWVFQKVPTTRGYAQVWSNGQQVVAHRASYELHVGPIPEETLDHLCKNRRCINPEHLEPCSRGENTLRGDTITAANRAKTHCKRGHPLAGENLLIGSNKGRPSRSCKACAKLSYERRRAAA